MIDPASSSYRPPLDLIGRNATNIEDDLPGYSCSFARKWLVVFTTSWVTLAACSSSTSLLSASDIIANEFDTRAELINLSSAGYLFVMGLSTFVWSPISYVVGRRIAYNACIVVLMLFTIATALASNLGAFVAFRLLAGLQGTFFHVSGQALLAEYFPPARRGNATGFFLAGTVLGPPIGPLLGGVIVTYQAWRVIIWLQVGMVGLGLILSLLVLGKESEGGPMNSSRHTLRQVMHETSPLRILRFLQYPSVLLTDVACGLLSWSQYALLSGPRSILSQQYGLDTPIYTGLFYLAPAGGFLIGTLLGGRFSDWTVRRWISKRDGLRLPQDRLRSGIAMWFGVVPASLLVYGWCIDQHVGGLALPVVMAFVASGGILAAFAGLNTYCAEVMPNNRREVIATKYLLQYTFSAGASASCVPLISATGVGVQCTISAVLCLLGGCLTSTVASHASEMQKKIDGKGAELATGDRVLAAV